MEQQPRKRGQPRLLVTVDVVERRKNSTRLQNAKRGCIQGEEPSQFGCSVDSPNITGSPTGGHSSSDSYPNLNDALLTGHANAEENSLGAELSRNGAEAECSNLYEASVIRSANIENTTTGLLETPRQRAFIDKKKKAFSNPDLAGIGVAYR
ncbi:hypothetical protein ACET3Z_011675 [Daucus carota]